MDIKTLLDAPALLATARLRLERPRPEHAAVVMASIDASLAELRVIDWRPEAFDAERAQRLCERDAELVAAGECLIYFAFEQASGAFVGNLDLHSFDFGVPRAEIGYIGDARRAGSGLMAEAATALLRLGFELGLERIEAFSDARNARAIAFAEKLGMTREGLLRGHARDADGRLCDEVVLAMRRGDPWPSYNRVTSPHP